MPTAAELIAKEDDELRKAQVSRNKKVKKIQDQEVQRIFKTLKKTDYFNIEFSDEELFEGLQNMVQLKSGAQGLLVSHDSELELESETSPSPETEPA